MAKTRTTQREKDLVQRERRCEFREQLVLQDKQWINERLTDIAGREKALAEALGPPLITRAAQLAQRERMLDHREELMELQGDWVNARLAEIVTRQRAMEDERRALDQYAEALGVTLPASRLKREERKRKQDRELSAWEQEKSSRAETTGNREFTLPAIPQLRRSQ